MKPKKCWFCTYLAKCENLIPCEKFKRYNYSSASTCFIKGKKCKKSQVYEYIAKKLNVSTRTVQRRLRDFDYEKSILKFAYGIEIEKTKEGYKIL